MFEKATRQAIRFNTGRGLASVEDLWQMPLLSKDGFNLDTLAKGLNKQLKENEEESFVATTANADIATTLKFKIVKHIIDVKLVEKDNSAKAVLRKEKKDRILNIIKEKQDTQLVKKSIEELTKELEDL